MGFINELQEENEQLKNQLAELRPQPAQSETSRNNEVKELEQLRSKITAFETERYNEKKKAAILNVMKSFTYHDAEQVAFLASEHLEYDITSDTLLSKNGDTPLAYFRDRAVTHYWEIGPTSVLDKESSRNAMTPQEKSDYITKYGL